MVAQRRWIGMGLGLLMVLVAGCSEAAAPEQPDDADEAEQFDDGGLDRSRELRARVRVAVSGAHTFEWQGEQTVQLTRVGNPEVQVNLLSAGFVDPVPLPDQPEGERVELFRWAFDLLQDYADEPGRFTIPATQPGQSGVSSNALFVYILLDRDVDEATSRDDVERFDTFNTVLEPCVLDIGEGEATGRLECPSIEGPEGQRVALVAEWEALE